ncbi:MAG: serine/threonine-protein kinase [Nannocystaceae bacterium]
MSRRNTKTGFVLEHARGRLEVHELARGVIFQDYYGAVDDGYLQPVLDLAERRLAQGCRLTFYSDISRVHTSTTAYRRGWSHWFKEYDSEINDIVVFAASIVPILAVKAANLITGGSIRIFYDRERFQTHIEQVVTAAWDSADDDSIDPPDDSESHAGKEFENSDTPVAALEVSSSTPDVFASPLERKLGLGALNAALFGESFNEQDEAGFSIGRFTVQHKLGTGGMGVVYACRDEVLDRDVAVKLLHARCDKTSRRRIMREAKAMARLSHPNVVTVHEIGESDGAAFLVMELVRGSTALSWLRAEKRETNEILDVFLGAGRGLAAAHANGLVHRDFKPENIMIDEDGRALVTDFGLARGEVADPVSEATDPATPTSSTETTATGIVVGTPAYMAPETFAEGRTDARTDQFSFCAAMWEGLYGQRPFTGGDLAALARAATEHSPLVPRGSAVPRKLREAMERGLMPDPRDRWASMEDLLDSLSTRRAWYRRWFTRDS